MRGIKRPHPALLASSNTKWTYTITVDMSLVDISGGGWGEYRLSEVPFCEYAMRVGPGPHSSLLVSSDTKCTCTITADMPIVPISEGPGMNIAYWRSHLANTQCESARPRIPLC